MLDTSKIARRLAVSSASPLAFEASGKVPFCS